MAAVVPVTVLHHGMFTVPAEMFWVWEVMEGEGLLQQEGVGQRSLGTKPGSMSLFNSYYCFISEGNLGPFSFLCSGLVLFQFS